MGLQEYLAKNYLSAATKTSKKRKRKEAKSEGLTIAEDDETSWAKTADRDDDDGDDAPTIAGTTLSGGLNVPSKNSKWIKVGAAAPTDSDQIAADAILADAQAEARSRQEADEEDPTVVEGGGPTMASGAMAGLQTADQVAAALRRKEKAERKAMKAAGLDSEGLAQQTIYRDASGRMINVKEKKAEIEDKKQEEERKKAEELESRKGDVQRREKEERRQLLEDAKTMTVARHADDKELNDELKARERWNDPMAQMLSTKKSSGKSGKGKTSAKTYQGAAEPNRYGIRPGWRWDGVDRSNGFEKKWFGARAAAEDKKALRYMWEMDE